MTPTENFHEREEREFAMDQRIEREHRFREPTDDEIRAELKRREQEKAEATDGEDQG